MNEFKDMLSMMMSAGLSGSASSGLSGASGLSGLLGSDSSDSMLSGMGSSGMSSMMAPMMFMMMEKLLDQQIEALTKANSQQSGSSQAASVPVASTISSPKATTNTVAASPSESITTNDSQSPHGMPVTGGITQASHSGHVALDIGIPIGTQVHATMAGKVISAGWNNEGYGNLVIVQNGAYKTYFAHLSQIPVSVGQEVKAGETVGISGSTGNSTGPHLHYEVRKDNVQIDPTSFTLK